MRALVVGLMLLLWMPAGEAVAAASPPVLAATLASNAPAYPPARRTDVVDVFHGVEVRDPYRWMEDLRSPELAAWIESQNALADPPPA